MLITIEWQGKKLKADLSRPICIAIPLEDGLENQPNAYFAPPFESAPVVSGDFVGSIEAGSPVNYYNVRVNPHGNGTHTETVGHLQAGNHAIHNEIQRSHYIAELITVIPTKEGSGDRVIHKEAIMEAVSHEAEVLVIRTTPNDEDKKSRKYSGTNPPYFSANAMQWIADQGYAHLMTDLPSVDREEDDGRLTAHKIFWQNQKINGISKTITEMIYVDNDVRDGIYLLDIQIAPIILDASPSRPILYKLNSES